MIVVLCTLFFFAGYSMRWLLGLAKIGSYFSKIGVILEIEALSLARNMDKVVVERLQELHERCLHRGDTREVLKLYENEDDDDLKKWRKKVMQILSDNFPEHVRRDFEHETWEEAMNNVEAYYLLLEAQRLHEKEDSRKHDGDEV